MSNQSAQSAGEDRLPEGVAPPAQRQPASWVWCVQNAIFGFLLLGAIAIPHSIKGANHAFKAALILWLMAVIFGGKRIVRQPLALPLLFYVLFSGISSALSAAPLLSWDRMKIVGLVLVVFLVLAQNLKTAGEVRVLVVVFVISAVFSAGLTAWQLTVGIGARITALAPDTALARAGVSPGDLIASVNGHAIYTPEQCRRLISAPKAGEAIRLGLRRGDDLRPFTLDTPQDNLATAGLLLPERLQRGKPARAQGFLQHPVVYAEMLVQAALLAWGLVVAGYARRPGWAVVMLLAILVIAGAVVATKTRSALGALLIVAFAMGCAALRRRARVIALTALLLIAALATVWVHRSRGLNWVDPQDPGTQFRVMVWKDGLRLARRHPWFGVGMDAARVHWREWDIQAFRQFQVQSHFHSDWIQLAADRGLPALAAWIWFVIAYLSLLFKRVRAAKERHWFEYGIALGLLGAFLAFLMQSVVHYNLGEEPLVIAFWFFAGMTVAVDRL